MANQVVAKQCLLSAWPKSQALCLLTFESAQYAINGSGNQRKVRALFSLARKLSPCIIFIDEVEAFLKSRAQLSNEPVMDKVKSEFLIEWDGLRTDSKKYENKKQETLDSDRKTSKDTCKPFSVLVLGATNRPGDVDEAFIRRMPRSFKS